MRVKVRGDLHFVYPSRKVEPSVFAGREGSAQSYIEGVILVTFDEPVGQQGRGPFAFNGEELIFVDTEPGRASSE